MTPADPTSEPVGSVAEEAFKLFRALSTQIVDAEGTEPRAAAHVCTTGWCPVCQVVGFVKANPDVVAQVSASATQLARSLRDLLDTALTPREDT